MTVPLPAIELQNILTPAYGPCPGFKGACQGTATWRPDVGHVPRGFLGASRSADQVELVLLLGEPGGANGSFRVHDQRINLLTQTVFDTYRHFSDRLAPLHKHLRPWLDCVYPGDEFDEQLAKTWITETYLCSLPKADAKAPRPAEHECASRYLAKQLALFPGRPIVAFGKTKAAPRVRRLASAAPALANQLIFAHALTPRPAQLKEAQRTWEAAATAARTIIEARRARS